jgi:hypothetical protein
MRFIAGLIVGIVLTVGAAYIHDMNVPPPPPPVSVTEPATPDSPAVVQPEPGTQRIVNWEVVRAITSAQAAWVRAQWDKLFG